MTSMFLALLNVGKRGVNKVDRVLAFFPHGGGRK